MAPTTPTAVRFACTTACLLFALAGCRPDDPADGVPSAVAPPQPSASTDEAPPMPDPPRDPAYVLDTSANRIDGTPTDLTDYKGDVILIVNTASKCGLTPQYAGLEKLYRDHKDQGFVVLGFPANEFMGQEPGTNEEIAEFCSTNFDVTFPMFEKVVVKADGGGGVHPLYAKLASLPEPVGVEPDWNFTKYLVDRNGNAVARFGPKTPPDDPELIAKVRALLAEPAEPST